MNDKIYDSTQDILFHKERVSSLLCIVIKALEERRRIHDNSKLRGIEKPTFDKYTPLLKTCTYGSDEYKQYLKEMQVGLKHHYEYNRHHPEHFKKYVCDICFKTYKEPPLDNCTCGNGSFSTESDISQMNLIDLIEMICDWKAATLRHNDGDIMKSIDINQVRFHYSDELKSILINTVDALQK